MIVKPRTIEVRNGIVYTAGAYLPDESEDNMMQVGNILPEGDDTPGDSQHQIDLSELLEDEEEVAEDETEEEAPKKPARTYKKPKNRRQ
jgi:hypothetical protein